jgi:hypothetical protein
VRKKINAGLKKESKSGAYGSIDFVFEYGIQGWFVNLGARSSEPDLEICINGTTVGAGSTNLYRKDISEMVGIDLPYGFNLLWNKEQLKEFVESYNESISVGLDIEVRSDSFVLPLRKRISFDEFINIVRIVDFETSESRSEFKPAKEVISEANKTKVIAFYLPQFHPFEENDEFWGKGFTEWTNVSKNRNQFSGHSALKTHGELGFYDLRLGEARASQISLAKEYGVYGFCYYFYQFGKRSVMDTPLREMLKSKDEDFPFCICWANESWTRSWDGSASEVLISQPDLQPGDLSFVEQISPIIQDARYIKVDDKPLIIIYRPDLIKDIYDVLKSWRQFFRDTGVGEVHFCMAETFGQSDPYRFGFDSSLEFPPHGLNVAEVTKQYLEENDVFQGKVYDYRDVVNSKLVSNQSNYMRFPGVMTSWDNSARRGKSAHVFVNSSPSEYEIWLRHAFDEASASLPETSRFVFVNAWNEWAEGAILEPHPIHKRAYLEATRRVVEQNIGLDAIDKILDLGGSISNNELASTLSEVRRISRTSKHYLQMHKQYGLPSDVIKMKSGEPKWLGKGYSNKGRGSIFQINAFREDRNVYTIDGENLVLIDGWSIPEGTSNFNWSRAQFETAYLVLINDKNEIKYHCYLGNRHSVNLGENEETNNLFGFKQVFNVKSVVKDVYGIGVAYRGGTGISGGQNVVQRFGCAIEIY